MFNSRNQYESLPTQKVEAALRLVNKTKRSDLRARLMTILQRSCASEFVTCADAFFVESVLALGEEEWNLTNTNRKQLMRLAI